MRLRALSLCALAGALSLTPAIRAADEPLPPPILLYDFGDGSGQFGATVTPAHTSATAIGRRDGQFTSFSVGDSLPPMSQGVLYATGDETDPESIDALTFELVIESGWEAALTGWSLTIDGETSTDRFEMVIEQIGPDQSAEFVANWGWFTLHRPGPISTDLLFIDEGASSPITLSGGQRYRFSLVYADYARTMFFDDVAVYGQMRAMPQVPEPATGLLLTAAAMAAAMRRSRG